MDVSWFSCFFLFFFFYLLISCTRKVYIHTHYYEHWSNTTSLLVNSAFGIWSKSVGNFSQVSIPMFMCASRDHDSKRAIRFCQQIGPLPPKKKKKFFLNSYSVMQLLGSAAKAVIPEKPYVFFLFLFLVPVLETEKKKNKKK